MPDRIGMLGLAWGGPGAPGVGSELLASGAVAAAVRCASGASPTATGARDGSGASPSGVGARDGASSIGDTPALSGEGRGAVAGQSRGALDNDTGPATRESGDRMGRRDGAPGQREKAATMALAAAATTSPRRIRWPRRRAHTSQRILSETAGAVQLSSWRHRP
jgi:hypothetical protein